MISSLSKSDLVRAEAALVRVFENANLSYFAEQDIHMALTCIRNAMNHMFPTPSSKEECHEGLD